MMWLDEWPVDLSSPTESLVEFLVLMQVVALVIMVLLLALTAPGFQWRVLRRCSFWCPSARRGVEVRFEQRGFPGFRRTTAVLACSAYDSPEAITCGRQCRDVTFRRQWEPALPVFGRGTS